MEPIARKIDEEWERIPKELVKKTADLGIFGGTIPEEWPSTKTIKLPSSPCPTTKSYITYMM